MIGASPYARNLPGTFFWSSFRDAFQSVSVAVLSAGDAGGSGAARPGRRAVAVPVSAGGAPMPRGGSLVVGVHSCPVCSLVSIRRVLCRQAEMDLARCRAPGTGLSSGRHAASRPGGAPYGIRSAGFSCRLVAAWSPPSAVPRAGRLGAGGLRRGKAQADGAELRSNREVAPTSPPAIGVSAARR